MTTSYVAGPTTVDTTSLIPGAITCNPMTTQIFSTPNVDQGFPIVDQGIALPQVPKSVLPEDTATYLPQTSYATSVPQIIIPDQTLTSFIPQATPSFIPTQSVQTMPVMADAGLQQVSVMPDAGIQKVSVMPDAGLQQVSVMPTAGVQQVSVMPTADVQQVSVMHTAIVQQMSDIPTAGIQSVITSPPVVTPPAPLAVASTLGAPTSISPATPEKMAASSMAQISGFSGTSVPPSTPQSGPVGPIIDEDFQRGRPVYDEFNEDRYRGFRFGR